jgi:hypothetical protein
MTWEGWLMATGPWAISKQQTDYYDNPFGYLIGFTQERRMWSVALIERPNGTFQS